MALVLLCVSAPFVTEMPYGDLVESFLMTVVMISAVLAVGARRRILILALVLVSPALVAKWANHLWPDLVPPFVYLAATILFFLFVVVRLLHFLFAAQRVDANVLCAGISGYVMLGLLWIPVYLLVTTLASGAFSVTERAGVTTTLGWL